MSSMTHESKRKDAKHALLARALEFQISDLQRALEERTTGADAVKSDRLSQLQTFDSAGDAQRKMKDQRFIQKMQAVASRIQSKAVDGSSHAPEEQWQQHGVGTAVWSALQRTGDAQGVEASETPTACDVPRPLVPSQNVTQYSFSPVHGFLFEGEIGVELEQTACDLSPELNTVPESTQELRRRAYSFLPADSLGKSTSSQQEHPRLIFGTAPENTTGIVSTPTFSVVDSFFY
eukprot:CAMPEP_0194477772 /NCGR_PEP_ID=MMETSP0253-20130528/1440_1 /TAXON_ID=2966 /ORGANISM="Noctiluca scintillans" /LENGTH=233 /DNA_ID=CAMNT_0039316793 /DNA_START=363 /DNA_END=1062 /DNA_ORIENTATION=-